MNQSDQPAAHMTPAQLAARWQVPQHRLAAWRHQGRGPNFIKIGQDVRYPSDEVAAYEQRHLRDAS